MQTAGGLALSLEREEPAEPLLEGVDCRPSSSSPTSSSVCSSTNGARPQRSKAKSIAATFGRSMKRSARGSNLRRTKPGRK